MNSNTGCGTSGIIAIDGWAKFFRSAKTKGRHLVADECQRLADLLEQFRTCITADDDRAMVYWQCGAEAERLLAKSGAEIFALQSKVSALSAALRKVDAAMPIAVAYSRDNGNAPLADLCASAGRAVREALTPMVDGDE